MKRNADNELKLNTPGKAIEDNLTLQLDAFIKKKEMNSRNKKE